MFLPHWGLRCPMSVNCLTSVLGVSGPNQWLFPGGTESAGTVTSPVALASGAGAGWGRQAAGAKAVAPDRWGVSLVPGPRGGEEQGSGGRPTPDGESRERMLWGGHPGLFTGAQLSSHLRAQLWSPVDPASVQALPFLAGGLTLL